MTHEEKIKLSKDLAEHIVENMSTKDLAQYAVDMMQWVYENDYTNEQLLSETKDLAPHLLENGE